MGDNCNPQFPSRKGFKRLPKLLTERGVERRADHFSVTRVQPRTSKGITDLLLLPFLRLGRR